MEKIWFVNNIVLVPDSLLTTLKSTFLCVVFIFFNLERSHGGFGAPHTGLGIVWR